MVVLKYGGTSVASRARWETIEQVAKTRLGAGLRPVLVCSAISKVSDTLERLLVKALTGEHEAVLEELRHTHESRAEELGLDKALVAEGLYDLQRLATGASLVREVSPRLRARVLAWGELLSTRLGAAFLKSRGLRVTWMDARECLEAVQDPVGPEARHFLAARCEDELDAALQARFTALFEAGTDIIVTQGFIARDKAGETVLLGRGGSDTSAAYLAAKLGAQRCEIWTDVPGIFSANPRDVPMARLLKRLDYDEAQELASMGAKVLHPRCIAPCQHRGIPLSIHSTERPDMEGTLIADTASTTPQVKAIAKKTGVMLLSMDTLGMWQEVGFLADIFAVFKEHGVSIDLVSTSESNVTVSLDKAATALSDAALDILVEDLQRLGPTRLIGPCAAVSLVGRSIRSILHELGPVLRPFEDQNVHLLSQAASDLNLTFVVDEGMADPLVQRLHQLLFAGRGDDPLLGPSFKELAEKSTRPRKTLPPAWWRQKRDALLEAAARVGTPLYVYDEERVEQTARSLKALKNVDRLFFAMKANSHPEILRLLRAAGVCFECVSPGELARVFETFSDLSPDEVLFTPNFAPRAEYEEAFARGVRVTVDSLHPLERWPEIFAGKDIFLRLDPGRGRGHHAHVRTAGAQSKFGIAPLDLAAAAALAKAAGATVKGLHAHAGSGIRTPDSWAETAAFLAEARGRFPEVTIFDLGGGLGVPEKPGQPPLDLAAVDASLEAVKRAHPDVALWLEPGRFYVADAGVLLARVTQVKQKGDVRYVGTDAGMNSLIRPALYGAFHDIVNLSRLEETARERVHVVGPICETGDTLGHARRIAPADEGDVLLVATAGAYGYAMGSRYNLREPAAEHILRRG
jgi:bifunctional diaminopimelate decarboxylase / aspartate kinase